MSVIVNGRFMGQRVTGMQRYAREIVARLPITPQLIQPTRPTNGMRGHLWEQTILPCRMGKGLLWSPCTTGPLAVKQQVVTIHDCAFIDQAGCFSQSFAAWLNWLVPRLARRVRAVLTVSEFSKQRIVEVCRLQPEQVHAIHNGVDPKFKPVGPDEQAAASDLFKLPAKYVLCVGSLEPRKNLRRLLEAWQLLGSQKAGYSLVLAGATSHVFSDAGLGDLPADVQLAGYIRDEHLAAVYSGATAFVYPSLYEGFGLTVLEAMACGVPVVTSNTTSLPEVAGEAALTVDPLNPEAIADGLTQLLTSETLRANLRAQGLVRAASFTWDKAAAATWQVLNPLQ